MAAPQVITLENYLLEYYAGDDLLWITFDHAGLPKHAVDRRAGWGAPELARHGWSVLAIKARAADWFLKPDLRAFFEGPELAKLTEGRRRIILYGLSMGGFGALGYSTFLPGSVALAISPQTTLDPVKVPWEKRFDYALSEDWTGPMGDINELTPAHAEAYVLYSPGNKFDGPQMARLDRFGPLTRLPLPGNAHVPAGMLKESGILKDLVQAVAAGPFDAGIMDDLRVKLEQSASYHYFLACEIDDLVARETAMQHCLELADPPRQEYYRQRIAGDLIRAAAKSNDREGTLRHCKTLRQCDAWPATLPLKLLTARCLIRVDALEIAGDVIAEAERNHPEGHPRLTAMREVYDFAVRDAAAVAASASDPGAPEVEQCTNG